MIPRSLVDRSRAYLSAESGATRSPRLSRRTRNPAGGRARPRTLVCRAELGANGFRHADGVTSCCAPRAVLQDAALLLLLEEIEPSRYRVNRRWSTGSASAHVDPLN